MLYIIKIIILVFLISPVSFASQKISVCEQRKYFLEAEQHLKKGHITQYYKTKKKILSYPLLPYLEYAELQRKIHKVPKKTYQKFINQYQDSPIGQRMHHLWLTTKSKLQHWDDFVKTYSPTENINLKCQYLYARFKHPGVDPSHQEMLPIWLHSKSRPKSCDLVFDQWQKKGGLTRSVIWQRIKLAIENKNYKLATYLSRKLSKPDQKKVQTWIDVDKDPFIITQKDFLKKKDQVFIEIAVHGLTKMAHKDTKKTISLWKNLSRHYSFNERHWIAIVREIGLALALSKNPNAYKWLARIPEHSMTTSLKEWRIRAALTIEDWKAVLEGIKDLPEKIAHTPQWIYWQARALGRLGQTALSQKLFHKIASTRSYHGFLASTHLIRPFSMNQQNLAIPREDLHRIRNLPAIKRAFELKNLKRFRLAQIEWEHAVKKMSDPDRQAAARIAANWRMPNWGILALAKAENKNNLNLRFPTAYRTKIIRESRSQKLDPALGFAIMRRESSFASDARSEAGALGLMQLRPGTGAMMAKKLKIPFRKQHLYDPDTNIRLGMTYLKTVMELYQNNPILAIAAYNAGHAKIKEWLPNNNMSPDIWVETIPYYQTREYVKSVLAYTLIYQQLLGRKPQMLAHMTHINKP